MKKGYIAMLEYEKKLHFDEHYKKLQSLNSAQRIVKLVWGVAGYCVIYIALKYVLKFIPDFRPWNSIGVWFTFCTIPFFKCDVVYLTFGLIASWYGNIRLTKITTQNRSVKDGSSDTPVKLLTDGCYSKVRHPMYGTFIILQSSLLLSLRSFIGIILALVVLVVQYINAVWEERTKLIPLFGDDYRNYSSAVHGMLLRKWEILVFAAVTLFSFMGIIM